MIASRDPVMLWRPWFRWLAGAGLAADVVRAALGGALSWASILGAIFMAMCLGHDWGVWEQRKADRSPSWRDIARVVEHAVRICARAPSLPWGLRHLYAVAGMVKGLALLWRLNERERELLRKVAGHREAPCP